MEEGGGQRGGQNNGNLPSRGTVPLEERRMAASMAQKGGDSLVISREKEILQDHLNWLGALLRCLVYCLTKEEDNTGQAVKLGRALGCTEPPRRPPAFLFSVFSISEK